MNKSICYRMLAFLVYFAVFLPWVGNVFLLYFAASRLVMLVICWLVCALGAQYMSALILRQVSWVRGYLILIILMSSAIMPFLLIKEGPVYLQLFLGILTIMVWVVGLIVATVNPINKFIEGKYLIIGLLLLSLNAFLFAGMSNLVYICFAVYLGAAAFLFMQIRGLNKFVSILGITSILLLAFGFAGIKGGLLYAAWWVYRYVIAYVLLGVITPFSLLTQLAAGHDQAKEPNSKPEGNIADPPDPKTELSDLKPGSMPSIDWVLIMKWFALAVLFIIVAVIIYRVFNKYFNKPKEEVEDEVTKEFVRPTLNFLPNLIRKGRSTLDSMKSSMLPLTMEGKIRKMYKQVAAKMIERTYPVLSNTTPSEAKNMITEEERYLFRLYNKIRYGEKKITSEQLSQAEESYQTIRKEIQHKNE